MQLTKFTQNQYFKKTVMPQLIAGAVVLGAYGIYKCASSTDNYITRNPNEKINNFSEYVEYQQNSIANQNKILHKLETVAQPTMTYEEFLEELQKQHP